MVRRIKIVSRTDSSQALSISYQLYCWAVPKLQSLVFGEDAPLPFVTVSLEILGAAMVPSLMLNLGGIKQEVP